MTATAVDPGAAEAPVERRSALTRQRIRAAWWFLAPMLAVLLLVAGWPLARTIWFGFTDASGAVLEEPRFIGFRNYLYYGPNLDDFDEDLGGYYIFYPPTRQSLVYREATDSFHDIDDGAPVAGIDRDLVFRWQGVLADRVWWRSVSNTLVLTVASVSIELVLGLMIALVLNARLPGRGLVRAAVLIPWAIPTVVSARMWNWMLNDQYGVVNEILLHLGIISTRVAWTADADLALPVVIAVDVWKTTPFMTLLILAALQMVPAEIHEAGRVDGISPVRMFFRVTLPLIRPALMVAVIFRALDALRIFDLIYVLTANSEATMSMSVYARRELVDFQSFGTGSAAATLLFLTIALLTVIYLTLGRVRLGDR